MFLSGDTERFPSIARRLPISPTLREKVRLEGVSRYIGTEAHDAYILEAPSIGVNSGGML